MRRVDPGPLSFLQPGWIAFHVAAIGGAILLGKALEKKFD